MEYLSPSSEVKMQPVDVKTLGVWATFHVAEGRGRLNKLDEPTSYAAIVDKLPATVDGFVLGTHISVQFGGSSNPQEFVRFDGKLYVPQDRCRLVHLVDLEEQLPHADFVNTMLSQGATTALQTTNGYIAYRPDIVQIIGQA